MASLAKGRMAPNSSVTRRTTRVVSAPSAMQLGVIGEQREFLVDAAAGHGFRDDLLALDVAFDAQIAPLEDGFLEIGDERRIAQDGQIRFLLGSTSATNFVADIKLQVVAIGADHALVKPMDSSPRAQWKAGSRTTSSAGSHCDL